MVMHESINYKLIQYVVFVGYDAENHVCLHGVQDPNINYNALESVISEARGKNIQIEYVTFKNTKCPNG